MAVPQVTNIAALKHGDLDIFRRVAEILDDSTMAWKVDIVRGNLNIENLDVEIGAVNILNIANEQINPSTIEKQQEIIDLLTNPPVPTDEDTVNEYGEAPLVDKDDITTVVSYVVPVGKTFYLRHASASGENLARFWLEIDGAKQDTQRTHFGKYNVDFFFEPPESGRGLKALATKTVRIRVIHSHDTAGDFDGKIYGVLK